MCADILHWMNLMLRLHKERVEGGGGGGGEEEGGDWELMQLS